MPYHLKNNGQIVKCEATMKACPKKHYESLTDYEKELDETFSDNQKIIKQKNITLSCNLGDFEVKDGDLSDNTARVALSAGLCADLALAIHEKTNKPMFALIYGNDTEEEFQNAFNESKNTIYRATHIVTKSEHADDEFVDSYGRLTLEDISDRYEANIVKVTKEMVEHYADGNVNLSKFADAAIKLDKDDYSYDWDEDDFG